MVCILFTTRNHPSFRSWRDRETQQSESDCHFGGTIPLGYTSTPFKASDGQRQINFVLRVVRARIDGRKRHKAGRNEKIPLNRSLIQLPIRDLIGQLVSEGFDRDDGVVE